MAVRNSTFKLNNGREMPMIGLGTFRIVGRDVIYRVIDAGLKAGYRAIDTAAVYQNEQDIGLALRTLLPKYNLTREDIFLTTKLAPNDHGSERAPKAVERSLSNLGVSYLDLYLIHWPGSSGVRVDSPDNGKVRDSTWAALVPLHRQGTLRAIGVSNYTRRHLGELLANCHGVQPAVDQVECHPHFRQTDLIELCREHGILVQAYSSLGGTSERNLLDDPEVCRVAKNIGRSSAQVLLCWALEQGIAIIPKSVTPERIAENLNLNFSISNNDMAILNSINRVEKYAWNPNSVV